VTLVCCQSPHTLVEILTEEMRDEYDIERLWILKRGTLEEFMTPNSEIKRFMFDPEDGILNVHTNTNTHTQTH
jgi:hypothetical protein